MYPAPNPFKCLMTAGIAAAALCGGAAPAAAASTIGFVVSSWGLAAYETKFWDECPEGTGVTNDEMWLKGLTAEKRQELTKNGTVEALSRQQYSYQRGATGQDICWDPGHFKEPPLRVVEGKLSFGMNLDGENEGRATKKTCAHENFVSPDGEPGIDNQMYRVLGCQNGWRGGGVLETYADQERTSSGRNLILIEITGVDDPRNDDNVEVGFYRSLDGMQQNAAGKIVAFSSYRADPERYGKKVKGSIKGGVLSTETADMTLPFYGNESYSEMVFKDMRLKMEMAPDHSGAKGILAGYYDIESWWHRIRALEYLSASYDINCPAIWEAANRLADGYPDENGKCTALSSAFNVIAVGGFVVHPKKGDESRTSENARMVKSAQAGEQ